MSPHVSHAQSGVADATTVLESAPGGKRKSTARPARLRSAPLIRPDGGRKPAYGVPELPPGKFRQCDGQMAMDLDSDDPGALVDPAAS
jgi:hypothetical protein